MSSTEKLLNELHDYTMYNIKYNIEVKANKFIIE